MKTILNGVRMLVIFCMLMQKIHTEHIFKNVNPSVRQKRNIINSLWGKGELRWDCMSKRKKKTEEKGKQKEEIPWVWKQEKGGVFNSIKSLYSFAFPF